MTAHQLKQIFDDSINLSSSYTSTDYLIHILRRLNSIDKTILTDPLVVNHQFYSAITNKLKAILKTWHKTNYLAEHESHLFRYLTRFLSTIKTGPESLVRSINKCLKDIAKNGKYLYDRNNMKSFSKLIDLYGQNQEIMNAITKCLCSNKYVEMFERSESKKFLVLTCPKYWINYNGKNM